MSTISLGISSTTNVVNLVLDPQNTLTISTVGSVTPTSILNLTDVNAGSITNGQVLVFDSTTGTFIPGSAGDTDTNIGNTDQTLTGVRDVELAGNNLTFSQGNTVRHTISPTLGATFFRGLTVDGDDSDGGKLSLKEASANGTSIFSLSAPASLASNVEFILPSTDGSSGQFLRTDGSGNLSFATPTDTDTNTNLGNTDQTLAAARDIELGGNNLTFSNSDTVVHTISPTTGVTFNRGINVTGTASSGASITLREDTDNGTDGVTLKAAAAIGSTLTLVLPSADGSDGHFLKTDGAGNLSFAADNNDNTTFSVSCVDGDNSDEEKIRLTGSDGSTDDIVLEAGTGLSISRSSDKITFTNTVSDTNTQLSTEEVQDIVGGMFTGNTETGISATYEDSDGTIDLVVSGGGFKMLQNYSYSDTGNKFFVQTDVTELSGSNAARDFRSAFAIPIAGSIHAATMMGASAMSGVTYRLIVHINNTATYFADAVGGDEVGSRFTCRWTAWKNSSDSSTASDPSYSANDYLAFQLIPQDTGSGRPANPGSVSLAVVTSHT